MRRDQDRTDRNDSRIPAEILEAVRRIEIRARRVVEEVFSGEYNSVFRGIGMEFREVREYVPGDDVRTIDWNVTARTDAPHVKLFTEERELTVMLMADVSRSGRFGSGRRTKIEIAAELCGVLAFCAITNKDKVGLILFSDRIEKYLPPAQGKSHVLRVIRELLMHEPEGEGTDLNVPLQLVAKVLKRKSTLFMVSDFWTGDFKQSLQVVGRRHDCVAVRIRDPRETDLPGVGLIDWIDAETGHRQVIDSSDGLTRRAVAQRAAALDSDLERLLLRQRVDLIEIDVTKSYVEPLQAFFSHREGRRRRSR